jgi:hypothetical protein
MGEEKMKEVPDQVQLVFPFMEGFVQEDQGKPLHVSGKSCSAGACDGEKHWNNKKSEQWISNPMSPRLLPLKQAAEYIGLTVWGMRERIWAGDIPVVRFPGGRKMFIDVRDIEAFIKRNKETIM